MLATAMISGWLLCAVAQTGAMNPGVSMNTGAPFRLSQAETQTPPGASSESAPLETPPAADDAEIEKALQQDAAAAEEAHGSGNASPSPSVTQSLNPDLSFTADIAAAAFSQKENRQTGGHDPNRRGFNLQQLELAVGSAVDPYFRFDANIVLFATGLEIEEVFATTLALPYRLQARVGQFLTRFGRANAMHLHAWEFVDQPFVLGRLFGGENNRGLGAELSYLAPLPWFLELSLSATDAAGEGTARSFYGARDLGVSTPAFLQYTGAAKQFFEFNDDWVMQWGLSGATGPNSTGHSNRTDIWGSDLYLKYRPLSNAAFTIVSLQTEVFYRRRQIPRDLLHDVGAYATLFWRFLPRWGTAVRYEYGSPARRLNGQLAGANDPLDPDWTKIRQRYSANLTCWPTEFSRIRLQGSVDEPPGTAQRIYAAFLAFEFTVGAHASHPF